MFAFLQLSQLIVSYGGLSKVVDFLGESHGQTRLPGIMTLGFIAAHSESLAMAVIQCKVRAQVLLCKTNRRKRIILT